MWIDPIVLERDDLGVRLEPLRIDHAPGLFAALDHDEVWRLRPDRRARTALDMVPWIEERLPGVTSGIVSIYATVIAASGEVAGTTCYLQLQPENRAVEIGATIIGPKWQRTFVNTHAKLLMLTRAFEQLGCVRVQFKVDTRNERSLRAVERLGAVREGVLRKSRICHDGYIRDTAVYSFVEAEWPAVKARLEGFASEGPRAESQRRGNESK